MHWLLATGDSVCSLRKKKEAHDRVGSIVKLNHIRSVGPGLFISTAGDCWAVSML